MSVFICCEVKVKEGLMSKTTRKLLWNMKLNRNTAILLLRHRKVLMLGTLAVVFFLLWAMTAYQQGPSPETMFLAREIYWQTPWPEIERPPGLTPI
jgi:hypothetical protein